jgi:hypothetical protein
MVNCQLHASADLIPRKNNLVNFLDSWLGPEEIEWMFWRSEKSLDPVKIWTTNHRLWIGMHQNIICPKCLVVTSIPNLNDTCSGFLCQVHPKLQEINSLRVSILLTEWMQRQTLDSLSSVYWQQTHYDTQVLVSRLTVTQMVTHLRQKWRHTIIDRFTPVDRKVDWKSALPII